MTPNQTGFIFLLAALVFLAVIAEYRNKRRSRPYDWERDGWGD